MKKMFFVAIFAIISAMFAANAAVAQPHIVHYEATGKLDSKMPDFKNALVAIDFGGPMAEEARRKFREIGNANLSEDEEGGHPCSIQQTVICVQVTSGPAVGMNSSSYSSGYGNSGGYSNQSSFYGNLYSINLTVTIIVWKDGKEVERLPIGIASTLAPSGSSTESIASYGRNGDGGTTNMYTTSGLNATIGVAIGKDISSLFEPKGFMGGLKKWTAKAGGALPHWIPGADQEVAVAFARDPVAQKDPAVQ